MTYFYCGTLVRNTPLERNSTQLTVSLVFFVDNRAPSIRIFFLPKPKALTFVAVSPFRVLLKPSFAITVSVYLWYLTSCVLLPFFSSCCRSEVFPQPPGHVSLTPYVYNMFEQPLECEGSLQQRLNTHIHIRGLAVYTLRCAVPGSLTCPGKNVSDKRAETTSVIV